ncbi:MAG: ABC transporter permease [Actinobacteria bacterium]|nr:ABC transporter permease [Actinomycetota bacterium]
MLGYIFRRIVSGVFVLWLVVTITFFLMKAIPGGPFTGEKNLPPAILHNLEARYHLDDPLWKQYADYLGNLVRWDLGPSFKEETRTVNDIINDGFPVSATIGGFSILFAVTFGVIAGVIAALRQNRWADQVLMFLATIGISVPSFIMSTLLMYILAYKLRLLPPAMWGSWKHAVMPTIALMGFTAAFITRLVRSSMLEVLGQDYMRTAQAKGLPGYMIIYRHALKNAILPAVTVLGPLAAAVLTGSLVVERIFAIPGMGTYFVNSIINRDYTVILGTTVFYCILLVAFNILVDITYGFIDPRIKLTGEE